MKLTEKQLECMRLGTDNTLSFGCLVLSKDFEERECLDLWIETVEEFQEAIWRRPAKIETIESNYYGVNDVKIIWHPITRWRLCYLSRKYQNIWSMSNRHTVEYWLKQNIELYDKTILDRPEELIDLVLSFLQSLKWSSQPKT